MKFDSQSRKLFKRLPKEIQSYFHEVDLKCKKHGVTLRLGGGKGLNISNGRCGGFFSDFHKELAVALNRPAKWILATLIHEESHFDQWLNLNSIWHDTDANNKFEKFFQWLDGFIELKNPTNCAQGVIAIELDCEKRSLRKIKKRWSHIISPDEYAQNANAYMYAYLFMAQSRHWIKAQLKNKSFYKHFPSKILNKFEKLSHQQFELFREHEKTASQKRSGF